MKLEEVQVMKLLNAFHIYLKELHDEASWRENYVELAEACR
jgi:hypothetical protein